MNKEEQYIKDFLIFTGHSNIIYEPDGKVPPDFLINDQIAVEVRRLNQHFDGREGRRGLEEIAIPLPRSMRNFLISFGPPIKSNSWFVHFDFRRPLEPWQTLRPKLKPILQRVFDCGEPLQDRVKVTENFGIRVTQAYKVFPTFYVLGSWVDRNAGGWLIPKLKENIEHCIREKSKKQQKNAKNRRLCT